MGQLKKRTKQELECMGSADWDKLIAKIPMCKIELTKQADAMRESGVAASDRDAAKRIAELTGRKASAIRTAIKRQRRALSGVSDPTKAKRKQAVCTKVGADSEIKQLKQELKAIKADIKTVNKEIDKVHEVFLQNYDKNLLDESLIDAWNACTEKLSDIEKRYR